MPEERKRQPLPPERLREVLARLNDVLAEAERLRNEVTRQLGLNLKIYLPLRSRAHRWISSGSCVATTSSSS